MKDLELFLYLINRSTHLVNETASGLVTAETQESVAGGNLVSRQLSVVARR